MITWLQLPPAVHCMSTPNNALYYCDNTAEMYVNPFDGDVYLEN
jgi:hypothetical protein